MAKAKIVVFYRSGSVVILKPNEAIAHRYINRDINNPDVIVLSSQMYPLKNNKKIIHVNNIDKLKDRLSDSKKKYAENVIK